jgi:hypothetical protein
MDHWTLTPKGDLKGSYYRRIEDIKRALMELGIPTSNPALNFVGYFFGCEKLAFGIIGIRDRAPAEEAYGPKELEVDEVVTAAHALNLSMAADDLRYLFSNRRERASLSPPVSARPLRNKLAHDFGPQQVFNINDQAKFLIPKMEAFLNCEREVLNYLRTNFALFQPSAAMSAIGTKRTWPSACTCPLLGVKRTCLFALHMSAFDPKRTSHTDCNFV